MPLYRRKSTTVMAAQFLPNEVLPRGVCTAACLDGDWKPAHVHTMHGNQSVILKYGDWVMPEPDGVHFYPCDAKVFADTYELA